MSKHKWIQSVTRDIKKRGTKGVCTGSKFGGPSCKPGTRRYSLAKTFKKISRNRKKEHGGEIEAYPFGGLIDRGVTGIASSLGANPENAGIWGDLGTFASGFIPGMQGNLFKGGAGLLGSA